MGRHSNYQNGMYQQLQEIMGRLENVEKEHKQEVKELKEEIFCLKKKIKPYVTKTSCYVMTMHV